MEKRQKIQIDLSRFRNYVDTLFFKQNDVNVYPVEIEILNNGDPFNLAEVTHISFINETPISKSVVEGPCTILDVTAGQIERLFDTNEIAEYGEAKAEIKLFSGEKLLSSAIFSYFIERTIYTDGSVESTPEYTSLQEALNRVDGALQEAEKRVTDAIGSIPSSVMKTWQPSRSVILGQVLYPTDPASPLAFECIQTGTTGTTEPTGSVMQVVTDGSAKWGIFDVRKRSPDLDGSFEFKNWTAPKRGYHVANGATLTSLSANYPSLYQALQDGEVLFVDTNAWSDISVSNTDGVVPYFGYDGGDTCILPDVRNMYFRASGTHNPQDYHGDAIRNITGRTYSGAAYVSLASIDGETSGAFYPIGDGIGGYPSSGGQHWAYRATLGIDADLVVPTGSENVPKTIVQLPVVFTGYKVV